jgi:protein farnesyltransferase subunit beta
MRSEGGFQGRTQKLVDGCYSFWQGAVPALLRKATEGRYGYLGEELAAAESVAAGGGGGGGGAMEVEGKEGGGGGAVGEDLCGWMTYNQRRLQQYILLCCQRPEGGLRDKPGK